MEIMEKENLQITAEEQQIFQNVKCILYQEMAEYVQNFAKTIKDEQSLGHNMLDDTKYLIAAIHICMYNNNKTMTLKFGEIKSCIDVKYYIYVYIENTAEESVYYRWMYQSYYLEKTGREYISNLFPMPYIAQIGEVDETKIYEYVHKYLDALKIMLAEEDFQKILYDPEFWVHANPDK